MGGEADAVAPFEAHLHVAHVRPRLAQRGHHPTSAEHFVGARGHLVDEHDDARCARRAAWLRSCAICPTSWKGLAYVSSEFARTWNAIESTTTRRTLRPGRLAHCSRAFVSLRRVGNATSKLHLRSRMVKDTQ